MTGQDPGSLMLVALIATAGVVIFWRVVLKLLLIILIVITIVGVTEFLHLFH